MNRIMMNMCYFVGGTLMTMDSRFFPEFAFQSFTIMTGNFSTYTHPAIYSAKNPQSVHFLENVWAATLAEYIAGSV